MRSALLVILAGVALVACAPEEEEDVILGAPAPILAEPVMEAPDPTARVAGCPIGGVGVEDGIGGTGCDPELK